MLRHLARAAAPAGRLAVAGAAAACRGPLPPRLPHALPACAFATKVPKSKRWELSTAPGNLPMGDIIGYTPVTPSLRHRRIVDKSHLWPGKSVPSLTHRIKSHAGRNNSGTITTRGRRAPKHRRLYRVIDFRRRRTDPAVVQRFEYDPNRSAFIALIKYESDGELSYILAPRDLAVGHTIRCGDDAAYAPGNAMPLSRIPDGTEVHNVELHRGRGGVLVRSAGTCATLQSKDEVFATLKMPSGELRKVRASCSATIGALSNDQWRNVVLGKAGASNWVGRGPKVRGVAMNPVDHPMGGGEGKSSGGRVSCSPWGWYTKGLRTRRMGKFSVQKSSKLIIRRRNAEKLGLPTKNAGKTW